MLCYSPVTVPNLEVAESHQIGSDLLLDILMTSSENKIKWGKKRISPVWGIFSVTGCYSIIWSTVQFSKVLKLPRGKVLDTHHNLGWSSSFFLKFCLVREAAFSQSCLSASCDLGDLRVEGMCHSPAGIWMPLCSQRFKGVQNEVCCVAGHSKWGAKVLVFTF